ncbi:MAG TPA: 2-dehydropantoate 2-reductase N-terminal domain-containing protein [Longimicrobium sp.]|nr:2-dehydropantoate 2-reductase N-terminal domain-containing protein [Longimicrobium sp.]
MSKRVLLVGAGAVGQVYARYLRAAGCEVSFLVKPAHAAQVRAGLTLHVFHGLSHTPRPEPLTVAEVLTSADEAAARAWDQVWLCVPSTALREGGWVAALAAATGEATWVMLQPALEDRAFLLQWVGAERLLVGAIPFIAFAAPLTPGAAPASGTALWMPPLASGLLAGPAARLADVTATLRAGGYPARRSADVAKAIAVPSAALTALVAGLEAVGWRFEALMQREARQRTVEAAREAVRVAAQHVRAGAGLPRAVLRPGVLRLLPLVARLVPFDLEAYLRVHFTKVRAQTQLMLEEYVALGQRAGLPVARLQGLLRPPGPGA